MWFLIVIMIYKGDEDMKINATRLSLARSRMVRQARRSGRTKILNGLSSRTSSNNILNSLNGTSSQSASNASQTKKLSKYENVEDAANSIQNIYKNMLNLAKTVDSEAKKTSDTASTSQENSSSATSGQTDSNQQKMVSYVNKFVDKYNAIYENLVGIGETSCKAYAAQLKSITGLNEKALENVGITKNNDGTLTVDSKKLDTADFDELKSLFATDSKYAAQINDKCACIEKSMSTLITALSKLYGTSNYNKYGTSSSYYGSNIGNWYSSLG